MKRELAMEILDMAAECVRLDELLPSSGGAALNIANRLAALSNKVRTCSLVEPAASEYRTASQVVIECNSLAIRMYESQGYTVPDGTKMYLATHPHEVSVWNAAVIAYEHIKGGDVQDCLSEMNDLG